MAGISPAILLSRPRPAGDGYLRSLPAAVINLVENKRWCLPQKVSPENKVSHGFQL
jgi:hypothetical protein